jgi:hypothetical protein
MRKQELFETIVLINLQIRKAAFHLQLWACRKPDWISTLRKRNSMFGLSAWNHMVKNNTKHWLSVIFFVWTIILIPKLFRPVRLK